MTAPETFAAFLKPTQLLDCQHPDILEFVRTTTAADTDPRARAVSLYYAIRDQMRYDPYACTPDPRSVQASAVLQARRGYCVGKAALLAACARTAGIPSRLGFADVRNHLSTPRLLELMGTDIFHYHGFTELWIADRWLKATPAFNLELCARFDVAPLEFNGIEDSIFHAFTGDGQQHMEYLAYYLPTDDVPLDALFDCYRRCYPKLFTLKANEYQDSPAQDGGWSASNVRGLSDETPIVAHTNHSK